MLKILSMITLSKWQNYKGSLFAFYRRAVIFHSASAQDSRRYPANFFHSTGYKNFSYNQTSSDLEVEGNSSKMPRAKKLLQPNGNELETGDVNGNEASELLKTKKMPAANITRKRAGRSASITAPNESEQELVKKAKLGDKTQKNSTNPDETGHAAIVKSKSRAQRVSATNKNIEGDQEVLTNIKTKKIPPKSRTKENEAVLSVQNGHGSSAEPEPVPIELNGNEDISKKKSDKLAATSVKTLNKITPPKVNQSKSRGRTPVPVSTSENSVEEKKVRKIKAKKPKVETAVKENNKEGDVKRGKTTMPKNSVDEEKTVKIKSKSAVEVVSNSDNDENSVNKVKAKKSAAEAKTAAKESSKDGDAKLLKTITKKKSAKSTVNVDANSLYSNREEPAEKAPVVNTVRGSRKRLPPDAYLEESTPSLERVPIKRSKLKQTSLAAFVTEPSNRAAREDDAANADPSRNRKRGATSSAPSKGGAAVEAIQNGTNTKASKSAKIKGGELLNATETNYKMEDFVISRQLDEDEGKFNLKISSWNVAGLRSWLKKGGLSFLDYEAPDIFCLQEIKCTPEQMPDEVARLPGYHPYWLCLPGGYAGVAIYSKIMPINVEYGIGNAEFDTAGRIITAEYEKFFLINVYVPNSGRKLVNLEMRMRWEELFLELVRRLDARKPVIISGDMNVSHNEIDLANPKGNTRNAGFTREERDKLTELLNGAGLIDTFRHFNPNKKSAYTFWTYMAKARARNVGWRLDYFLVSERLMQRVIDSCIRMQCMGSDHCPITLYLNV